MYTAKQMIVMRRDLKMRKGKIAAQAGHACVEATLLALMRENRLNDLREGEGYLTLDPAGKQPSPLSEWFTRGVAKICVYVDSEKNCWRLTARRRKWGIYRR